MDTRLNGNICVIIDGESFEFHSKCGGLIAKYQNAKTMAAHHAFALQKLQDASVPQIEPMPYPSVNRPDLPG